jgi:hypothetical protein
MNYSRDLRLAKRALGPVCGSIPEPLMSALGQKRTLTTTRAMSALPPIADIVQHDRDVCFVPKADIQFGLEGEAARTL